MTSNPDIVIATPGRFLHLTIEMALDLSSVNYVVFDEADRLFEMGYVAISRIPNLNFRHVLRVIRFAAQLTEILHALPPSRQTLLFSATLPKSLVEFARAGLQEPRLVRLDADSKISQDLQSAFFTTKSEEKEGALLHILSDVIQIPLGQTEAAGREKEDAGKISKKRKRGDNNEPKPRDTPTEHSTIIFCSTKHVRNLFRSHHFLHPPPLEASHFSYYLSLS
jgi:ATP-dependent RNA helicase DDX54/DBP10